MRSDGRQLKLGFSLVSNGTHKAGWRHPSAHPNAALDVAMWKDIARAAERAKVHFIFLADGAAVRIEVPDDETLSYSGRIDTFEPVTLLTMMSGVTERLGFVATASTTYNEPYTVARKYASLDHLSGGRAGWNVVTSWSDNEARNFNLARGLEHATRYRRANEFIDVVMGLWDSWDDDAFIRDKQTGRYFDPRKLHTLNHKGEFFTVRGPLNIARPIQGYPVIAQAGGSEPGQELAARTADLVYTAQQDFDEARKFYIGLKGRLGKFGRSEDSVLIMPGVLTVVGRTDEEARENFEQLQNLVHPSTTMSFLKRHFGDLSAFPLDGPMPETLPETNTLKSTRQAWIERARRENLTIRQVGQGMATAGGHRLLVGSPKHIADALEDWFVRGACDGFTIMVPHMPQGVYDIVDLVIPELRRRGLFQTDYAGRTLRETLGLPRPPNQFFAADGGGRVRTKLAASAD
jgi:N-acetyl-S-(2-succino)cysteine monooxygenase